MLSGIKPLTITKRQAKELLPPKLVDRLIYAAKNFPETGWLEFLPKEEGKEVRETYIVYESLERAFQRIRAGEYPPDLPGGRSSKIGFGIRSAGFTTTYLRFRAHSKSVTSVTK